MIWFLVICVSFTKGIIDEESIKLEDNDSPQSYLWFGFESGGTVEQTVKVVADSNSTVAFYLCDKEQKENLANKFEKDNACQNLRKVVKLCDYSMIMNYLPDPHINDTRFTEFMDELDVDIDSLNHTELIQYEEMFLRNLTNSTQGEVILNSQNNTETIGWEIKDNKSYWFLINNCGQSKVSIDLEFVVMNPGGEHLPVGFLEIKYVMAGAKHTWSGILGIWIILWAISCRKKPSTIQMFLMLDGCLWIVYAYLNHQYWIRYSNEGIPDSDLLHISFTFLMCAEGLLFSIITLIAAGSGILTKVQLSSLSKCIMPFVVVSGSLWVTDYIQNFTYYVLAAVYIIMLKLYCIFISRNCKKLSKQVQLISQIGIDPISTPIWQRLRMFRLLRTALLILLIGLSVGVIISYLLLEYLPWIALFTHQFILIHIYLILMMNFRLRKKCPYFDPVERLALSEDGPMIDLENITETMIHEYINKWKSCLPFDSNKVLDLVTEVLIIEFPGDTPSTPEMKVAVPLNVNLDIVNIEEEVSERAKDYQVDNSEDSSDGDSVISIGEIYLEIPEPQLQYYLYPQHSHSTPISYS